MTVPATSAPPKQPPSPFPLRRRYCPVRPSTPRSPRPPRRAAPRGSLCGPGVVPERCRSDAGRLAGLEPWLERSAGQQRVPGPDWHRRHGHTEPAWNGRNGFNGGNGTNTTARCIAREGGWGPANAPAKRRDGRPNARTRPRRREPPDARARNCGLVVDSAASAPRPRRVQPAASPMGAQAWQWLRWLCPALPGFAAVAVGGPIAAGAARSARIVPHPHTWFWPRHSEGRPRARPPSITPV